MIFEQDGWQEIISTLRKNRLRSVLTAFGVFWGIFMLIIMLGSGNGLRNGEIQRFNKTVTNSVFIWTNPTTKPYKGFPRGRRFYFDNDDVKALRENIPEIKYLAPRCRIRASSEGANNVTRGLNSGAFTIYGDSPEITNINSIKISSGRFINPLDQQYKRKVAVLGTRVEEVLFESDEDPIGEYIEINGVYFQVVGTFIVESLNENDEDRQTIFIPQTTFQQVYNWGNTVAWLSITSIDGIPVSEVEKKVIPFLARRHDIALDDVHAFGHFNLEKIYKKVMGLFSGIRGLTWFVGIFSLLAGVIGVSNIMLVIVKERTKEIGIRRAIGATPWAIIKQIILETILLTSFAGYAGLVVGVAVMELTAKPLVGMESKMEMFKNPGVDLGVGIIAICILILSGALAGLIPAKRAVSVKPVDAIRNE
jgi:putative ABC transport system permease protein